MKRVLPFSNAANDYSTSDAQRPRYPSGFESNFDSRDTQLDPVDEVAGPVSREHFQQALTDFVQNEPGYEEIAHALWRAVDPDNRTGTINLSLCEPVEVLTCQESLIAAMPLAAASTGVQLRRLVLPAGLKQIPDWLIVFNKLEEITCPKFKGREMDVRDCLLPSGTLWIDDPGSLRTVRVNKNTAVKGHESHIPVKIIETYEEYGVPRHTTRTSTPYLSDPNLEADNFNMLAEFVDSPDDEPISCRHLSIQWILERIKQGIAQQFSYHALSSIKNISDNVGWITETIHRSVSYHSPVNSLVACSQLGPFLRDEFRSLEDELRGPSPVRRLMVWNSPTHITACELLVRPQGEHPRYQLDFYESNKTRIHRTLEAANLLETASWSIGMLLSPDECKELIGVGADPFFTAHTWISESPDKPASPKTTDAMTRKLSWHVSEEQRADPATAFFLLAFNFPQQLLDLTADKISNMTPDATYLFLKAQAGANAATNGLQRAIFHGHDQIVSIHLKVISDSAPSIGSSRVAELVFSDVGDGGSALEAAFENNRPETVRSYLKSVSDELVNVLQNQDLFRILFPKSAIESALNEGDGLGAVEAYLDSLVNLSNNIPLEDYQWRELIGTILHFTLAGGHTRLIEVLGQLIEHSPQLLDHLLDERHRDGKSGLHAGLAKGHAEALVLHLKLLAQHQQAFEPDRLARVLLAVDSSGTPGMVAAIRNKKPIANDAYAHGLMRFDTQTRTMVAKGLSDWVDSGGGAELLTSEVAFIVDLTKRL